MKKTLVLFISVIIIISINCMLFYNKKGEKAINNSKGATEIVNISNDEINNITDNTIKNDCEKICSGADKYLYEYEILGSNETEDNINIYVALVAQWYNKTDSRYAVFGGSGTVEESVVGCIRIDKDNNNSTLLKPEGAPKDVFGDYASTASKYNFDKLLNKLHDDEEKLI